MMFHRALSLALLLLFSGTALSETSSAEAASSETTAHPTVTLHTSKGDIRIELYPERAPVTVANFLNYARSGHYNGTIFHRVIKRFVIQGGGFDKDLFEKPTGDSIINEAKTAKMNNERWTVAMARTDDPNSARAQFFINLRMNLSLDARAGNPGYAVFGKVIEGQNVARDISLSKTGQIAMFDDVPLEPITINSVSIDEPAK
ncbi:peptidylprolyl isomerase [Spongiibacter sp. KMU-158]|uniref:Peptidyl-prolyl cis-trans isomerase n=1 Tax=Spongiibacter pelagi TaxID=2760804 RepID=A0A927GVX9_9GAMM|nr:peptidylprolyl isomerase [Spongiibacter pelagi]MBD2859126.1 peptidylprolyl isomerase [Spongiibacter pelagi]